MFWPVALRQLHNLFQWLADHVTCCAAYCCPAAIKHPTIPPAARRFQKGIADKLKAIEVDPEDKSMRAFFIRARNFAFRGITHDIHADIVHDEKLTQVGYHLGTILRVLGM
jgi:hypothetical protein